MSRAVSTGLPQRPPGFWVATRAHSPLPAYPVSLGPGSMQLTVIPLGMRWAAKLGVSWCKAPLEAM
jgi:hypothetical protein